MNATQWLEVLASYSLQVLAVIVVCTLLERAVAKTADRCALWSSCFMCVLLLGCAVLVLPRIHLIQPWSRLDPHLVLTVSAAQDYLGRLLLATWSLGATVSMVLWVVRSHRLRRILANCEQLPSTEVERLFGEANLAQRLDRLPIVLVSDDCSGPFCRQFHEPTVVLPRFVLEGSHEDLRHVLLHEFEHLATHHPLQLFWQQLVQVACWFHPAVWNAATRASLMREFSCDEAATSHGADSAAYLRTLLRIAERCEQNRVVGAIGFGRSPSEIVLRARWLVDLAKDGKEQTRRGLVGKRMAIAVLFVVTLLIGMISVPSDPLASPRAMLSPWPRWTAQAAHCFGVSLRDFELYDRRSQIFEVIRDANRASAAAPFDVPENLVHH